MRSDHFPLAHKAAPGWVLGSFYLLGAFSLGEGRDTFGPSQAASSWWQRLERQGLTVEGAFAWGHMQRRRKRVFQAVRAA
jgi:hypothetical protein